MKEGGREGGVLAGSGGVIYSKLQIYTHTQNCTENKYVHAQGFYFLTITHNFPNMCSSSSSSVVAVFNVTSGECCTGPSSSFSSSSSPVCSVLKWEAGLVGRLDL